MNDKHRCYEDPSLRDEPSQEDADRVDLARHDLDRATALVEQELGGEVIDEYNQPWSDAHAKIMADYDAYLEQVDQHLRFADENTMSEEDDDE